jgi:hypothetical protein
MQRRAASSNPVRSLTAAKTVDSLGTCHLVVSCRTAGDGNEQVNKTALVTPDSSTGGGKTALDPNLIMRLGNTPLWAMGGNTGVDKLRGTTRLSTHTAIGYKLLPIYHAPNNLRRSEN